MPNLNIIPDDVSDSEAMNAIIDVASPYLCRSGTDAVYGILPDDGDAKVFIAQSPMNAVRWICKRVSRPAFSKIIQHCYDFPDTIIEAHGADGSSDDNILTDAARGDEQATGRQKSSRKEKTTREVNREMVRKVNTALVQSIASSQDVVRAKSAITLSEEELRYRRWGAKQLHGAGIDLVTTMINKAVAVGTAEVLWDWQAIVMVWSRQARHKRKLFDDDGPGNEQAVLVMNTQQQQQQQQQHLLTLASQSQMDDVGLTVRERDDFRRTWFRTQKRRVDGIAGDMRHRWDMHNLYEEYDRLERKIRSRAENSGGRGRRYAVVAKEHLFAVVHEEDYGPNVDKEQYPLDWKRFGQWLDWGKRWHLLKNKFESVGIFAILPERLIPNAFIEKTLSQRRVVQWMDMLAECNDHVQELAWKMEPLFLACMHEDPIPPQYEFLAKLDDYAHEPPLALLEGVELPTSTIGGRALSQRGRVVSVADSDDDSGEEYIGE